VRRAAIVGIGLAQAAAVLVAVLAWPRPQPGAGPVVAHVEAPAAIKPAPAPAAAAYKDIEAGQTVIISADGRGVRVCDLNDGTNTVDRNWAIFNAIEPLASFETMASLQ
jgi:hypothetical protein